MILHALASEFLLFYFYGKMFLGRVSRNVCRPSALGSVRKARTALETAPGLTAITGHDLYWECYLRSKPVVLIDARATEAYEKFHIMGTISVPHTELESTDFSTIPKDRQVFVMGGDTEKEEREAVELALKIASTHPAVTFVRGGTDDIRRAGFLYKKEVERPSAE